MESEGVDDFDLVLQLGDPIIGLTERERRFGEAYFEVALQHSDSNSSLLLAYRRAFPLSENSDRSAHMLARSLVQAPRVQVLVSRLRESLSMRRAIPAERIIQEVERIALSNVMDYLNISQDGKGMVVSLSRLTPATAAVIQEITIDETYNHKSDTTHRVAKIKLYDKLSALNSLARMKGLIRDRPFRLSLDDLDTMIHDMRHQLEDRGVTIDHISGGSDAVEPVVRSANQASDGGGGK